MAEEQPAVPPLALRVAEVARLLQISRSAVYVLIGSGELPHLRVGRSLRVPRQGLEQWVEAQTVNPAPGRARPVDHPPMRSAITPTRASLGARTALTPKAAGRAPKRISSANRVGRGSKESAALIRGEPQPWRIFVDEAVAGAIKSDTELLDVLRRLDEKRWLRVGVGSVTVQAVHERGICWNVRQAYEQSDGLFGGRGALGHDTWYPDIVATDDAALTAALRNDNPWFPIRDSAAFRLEVADMRAEVLGEGESPFPDRVKKRHALRRYERRRARRDRQRAESE